MSRSDRIVPLDLHHDGLEGAICAHVLEAPDPVVVDPGPSSSLDALRAGLAEAGFAVADLRHILLTHVHLDHAGATGHLVRENPRVTVHVHADGAPHMADPERLVRSTRRTFGEAHDRLWGPVLPVPPERIQAWRPGEAGGFRDVRFFHSPGHIAHHVSYLAERAGILLAGDSLGIILDPEAPTHPATPPPAVDLAAWHHTLEETYAGLGPDGLALAHFGVLDGERNSLDRRREELARVLEEMEARVGRAMAAGPEAEEEDRAAFHAEAVEVAAAHVGTERAERYFQAFSPASDWDGVRFHLARREG
ncbi:MAG: MBL fold metallo-hydrolase [Gemmatimonadales bacterium]|nr:MAG: MBL fold metallo-hydrolase [Gemmatimonadales bacterium]